MPQVPYNPVPEALPSTQATPTKQLNKKAAFGENIVSGLDRLADGMARMAQGSDALARGQEKLAAGMGEEAAGIVNLGRGQEKLATGQAAFGKALDHAGTEIFGRAILLQNIVNESDARDMNTKYSMQASDMYAEYGAKRGKAASEAFPAFQKGLADLRMEYKESLKNPMAQKMFDSESQGTMTRTMFAGAQHAKNSIKQFQAETLKAEIIWNQEAPYKDIKDPAEYAVRQQAIINSVTALGINENGLDPLKDKDHAIIKAGVLVGTSTQRRNQILQVARDEPFTADGLVKTHWNEMIPRDQLFVKDYVDGRAMVSGASNRAREVILNNQNPDGTFKKSNPEMRAELDVLMEEAAPGNKDARRTAQGVLESGIVSAGNMRRHDVLELNQQMASLIQEKGIRNRAEFENDPQGSAIAQRLKVINPGAYAKLDDTVTNIAEQSKRDSNTANYQRIMGLSPLELIDYNVNEDRNLGQDHAELIRKEQKRLIKNPVSDPAVKRAMSWIENKRPAEFLQMTTANGVADKNKMAGFRGAVSVALDMWKQNNEGKPAGIDEVIDKIFPELRAESGHVNWSIFGWGDRDSVYFGTIPRGIEDQLRINLNAQLGRAPTKDELRREYQMYRFYDRMFGSGTGGPEHQPTNWDMGYPSRPASGPVAVPPDKIAPAIPLRPLRRGVE